MGLFSLIQPCESQELNSGHQAEWQSPIYPLSRYTGPDSSLFELGKRWGLKYRDQNNNCVSASVAGLVADIWPAPHTGPVLQLCRAKVSPTKPV